VDAIELVSVDSKTMVWITNKRKIKQRKSEIKEKYRK
jgi:hypothetical protein